MDALLKKLQFKGQDPLLVIDAPPEFGEQLESFGRESHVVIDPEARERFGFVLAFAKNAADISRQQSILVDKLEDDALLWWAYPKKSSKKYDSDISRDNGWEPLGKWGYEGVRQVAINDDWSALRFRHVDHIKTMQRDTSRAMSKKGKQRTRKD